MTGATGERPGKRISHALRQSEPGEWLKSYVRQLVLYRCDTAGSAPYYHAQFVWCKTRPWRQLTAIIFDTPGHGAVFNAAQPHRRIPFTLVEKSLRGKMKELLRDHPLVPLAHTALEPDQEWEMRWRSIDDPE